MLAVSSTRTNDSEYLMFEFTDKDPAIVAVVERIWERLGPEAISVADL